MNVMRDLSQIAVTLVLLYLIFGWLTGEVSFDIQSIWSGIL